MTEEEKNKAEIALAYLKKSGEIWKQQNGEDKFKKQTELLKQQIMVWNKLTGSTVPFNLNTVETIMCVISSLPFMLRDQGILGIPGFIDFSAAVSAVRNGLIAERDEKIWQNIPGLSTPPKKDLL